MKKILMLDIYATRQAYKEQDISNIDFVRSNQNIAERLAKSTNQGALHHVITFGKLSIDVEQWIVRKPKDVHEECC